MRESVFFRDPAIVGMLASAICGFDGLGPWVITPLTVAITALIAIFGSPMFADKLRYARTRSNAESVAVAIILGFGSVVAAYAAGDLSQHLLK